MPLMTDLYVLNAVLNLFPTFSTKDNLLLEYLLKVHIAAWAIAFWKFSKAISKYPLGQKYIFLLERPALYKMALVNLLPFIGLFP